MYKGEKGFFYKNKYYLMPNGAKNVEKLYKMGEFVTVELCQTNCQPPDFVLEDVKKVKISVDSDAFPVSVNLYSRAEYDRMLAAQVKEKCQSCKKFQGDETDLSGHYDEMSLSGFCYLKERGEEPTFGDGMSAFIEEFAERSAEFKALLSDKNQEAFRKEIQEMLSIFFAPFEVAGGLDGEGRYCLCFSAKDIPASIQSVFNSLCKGFNERMAGEDWVAFPYYPKGIYRPELSSEHIKMPPRLFYKRTSEETRFEVFVYCEEASDWEDDEIITQNDELYKYFCYAVGENVFSACASHIKISSELPDGEETDAETLGLMMENVLTEYFGEVPYPVPHLIRPTTKNFKAYPYKEDFFAWTTVADEFSPVSDVKTGETGGDVQIMGLENLSGQFFRSTFGIGYIYVYIEDGGVGERNGLEEAWKAEMEKLPYGGNTVAVPVGTVRTEKGTCFDFMVFNEGAFFDLLHRLAPVLTAFQAKIVSVNQEGTMIYDAGYEILPADMDIYS